MILAAGCGASKKSLDEGEARIQAMMDKGFPDSLLADAKLYLFEARSAKQMGNTRRAQEYADSLVMALDKVEAELAAETEKLKPYVDSLWASIKERKKGLTGQQLLVADSIAGIIDSFLTATWLAQAKDKCVELDETLPGLLQDEEIAAKTRPKVIGTWTSTRAPGDKRFKATEKRLVKFAADGTVEMVEEMKGQTDEYLKEDWKFESSGTWDVKGDTVLVSITKETCVRQIYDNLKVEGAKKTWERKVMPTYQDSAITGGAKDRFMTFDYIKENFTRK
jgi:hypothetical protein